MTEVADGVFAYVQPDGGWCLNNAGVVVGDDGILLVDTAATERRATLLRTAVDGLSRGGVKYLVNTHFHGDHTFGNHLFADTATIIAQHGTRAEMAETGLALTGLWPEVNWGNVDPVLPTVTYHDALTLHLGRCRAELFNVGPAHTGHDTVVWLPGEKVLFTGDVVLPGCTPFLLMGTVAGSLTAVRRMRETGAQVVVGGHGTIAGPEAFDETEAYLLWLRDAAGDAMRKGLTPIQAARQCSAGRFAGWKDPERLVPNLHRAIAEHQGAPPAAALPVEPLFAEMVEFNGGHLPECHA
ncbi:MBL fold metallo-hydrolase [Frankia sp. CcI156]|jgi:cyclase|nr:MBL fold metallo-hydrolase [Frankia sp. CgIS1]ONH22634.1 MBL fold metallo-hydrolase [Frankia sp. CcI156]